MPAPFNQQNATALGFVLLSGTGFVGARLGLAHAEPLTFLAWRFALAGLILLMLAIALRARWPSGWRAWADITLAGLLSIGCFSAGVFYSLRLGLAPAISAMIIALQPLIIAVIAPRLLGERITPRHWLGLLLGLLGVFLILQQSMQVEGVGPAAILGAVLGLCGMAAGNLYQKARCPDFHPFSGGAIQCATCAVACAGGAFCFESGQVEWTSTFVIAWLWMALVVSVGAVSLLILLIRDGNVSRVGGLFYLVPVSAALAAWQLFGQHPSPLQFLGMLIAGGGVALTQGLPKSGRQG